MNAAEDKPTIRILHHMARSGGTLISRCLGCMEGVTLLSEVNPIPYRAMTAETVGECAQFHPIVQAYKWFGLFSVEEAEMLSVQTSLEYSTLIELVHRRCGMLGTTLLLRDWSHADFTAHPPFPAPTYQFTIVEALKDQFSIQRTASVRHPIDQWLSLRRLSVVHGNVSVEHFLHGYRRFAEGCVEMGFVRYEDLVTSPETEIRRLCERLSLQFDPGFSTKWANYLKVTGDITQSRDDGTIKKLPRREFEPELMVQFEASDDYWKSLELLGYAHPEGVSASTTASAVVPAPNFLDRMRENASPFSIQESSTP